MDNTGIILTLAYPDTIVTIAEEWYSDYLRFLGIGKKNYVRAGHAALVLINIAGCELEYYDFGRYISPEPMARVRGKITDNELQIPIIAEIKENRIINLNVILQFLATHPKLTHGDGRLVASVCNAVNYEKAKAHITRMQNKHFIRYAAFIKEACNCARFVTDTLIASVTNDFIKKKLVKSKWFTPSTVGNVLIANTEKCVFEISEKGIVSEFKGTQKSENLRCFLDRLKGYNPGFVGTLRPRKVKGLSQDAQWLSGIAAGAWYEIYKTEHINEYRYRRISPYGNIDCDALFLIEEKGFDIKKKYQFIHYSNCWFFNITQGNKTYKFVRKQNRF